MQVYLETECLILRRLTLEDADVLYALDNDPEVMRYINAGAPVSYATIREQLLPRYLSYYETGADYGYWAAIEKESGEFIGWFHFRPARDTEEIELGYRLKRAAWGKGYATEGSRALVRKGFQELGLPRIIAKTLTANQASRHVMEKLGMRLVEHFWEERFIGEDKSAVLYALDREDYRPEA
ncbi:MAG TPA: GNAT family N-acetyltransferase [Chthonomonadaceae bacterium]|nr:GNAT family N-acetyltransferase [Chthonomonadaceae bacterium]